MKKILCTALCTAMMLTAVPVNAEDLIIPEKGEISTSCSVYCGDTNFDSVIDAVDLMNLKKILFGEDYSFNAGLINIGQKNADVNFDGSINILDMIALKQAILAGENTFEKVSVIEISDKPVEDYEEKGCIITCVSELREYLKNITDDPDRTEAWISKYNDDFFENSDLAVDVIYQERGEGVMYFPLTGFWIKDVEYNNEQISGAAVICIDTYAYNQAFYPITDTYLFVQTTIPKISCDNLSAGVIDLSNVFKPNYSGYHYSSPDGKNEIFIVQESFLLISSVTVYRDNHDGTFTYLRYLSSDDGHNPFDANGEWKKDDEGNDIFTNDTDYIFHWYDDRVEIEYTWEYGKWTSDTIMFE